MMKNRFARLLFAIAFLCLLSCQQQDRSTGSTSESIPLAVRLVAATGDAIPESDTLRFVVVVGSRTMDTLVAWARHELDLGSVKEGDEITWQAMAWKWDSTKTIRRVVWVSQKLRITARSAGNGQALTLETPVQVTNLEAPKFVPEGFTVGTANSVPLSYADSSFRFAFTVSEGVDTVRIDDSLVKGESGTYSRTIVVTAGSTKVVNVWMKDTLGSITILRFNLVRALRPTIDSSLEVDFETPSADTTLKYEDSTLAVRLRTTSKLHVDTVRVGTKVLSRDDEDSTLWTGDLGVIKVGKDSLHAVAIAGSRRGTDALAVERLKKGEIDSSVKVAFVVPGDTTISWKDSTLAVRLRTTSKLHVDTVRVGTKVLSRDDEDSTLWTGSIDGIKVGKDTLRAIAIAGTRRDTAKRQVTRSAKPDSSVKVSFRNPTDKSRLAFKDSSIQVEVKVVTSISVVSVLVGKDTLTRSGTNDSLWVGLVRGLTVGDNTLKAIASAGSKKDSASIVVTRAQDSSITATFVSPDGETIVPNSQKSIAVKVKVITKLPVASVLVGKDTLKSESDSIWAGAVKELAEGENVLKALVMAGGKRDSATLTVKRAGDSTVSAIFVEPKDDTVLSNSDSMLAVTVKVTSKLVVTSVKIGAVDLKKDARDTTLWKGEIRDIAVGTDTLRAVATAGTKTDVAKRAVTRRGLMDKPTFAPGASRNVGTLSVTIEGPNLATLEYSTDRNEWVSYSNPVAISKTQTLYARAHRTGMDTSYASARYVIVADTPTFEPATRTSIDSVRVTIRSAKSGSTIFWSADNVKWKVYSAPIYFDSNVTLYSKVYVDGLDTSAVGKASFRVAASKPTISPNGNATAVVDSQEVTLATTTKGATIAWSTDNVTWNSGTRVALKANATLYAKAVRQGMDSSATSQATFHVKPAAPKIDPVGGTFTGDKDVTLSAPSGLSLLWSTTGKTWNTYTGPVRMTQNDTLFARSWKLGMDTSDAAKAYFQIRVETPELKTGNSVFAAYQVVTFATATTGATLQWSVDTGVKWYDYTTTGVTLDSSVTLYVRASKTNMLTSGVLKVTFTDTAFGYPKKNNPRRSAGCGKVTNIASGKFDISFADTIRSYVINVPASYDVNKPYRLVFGMHPMGGSAAKVATDNWFNLVQLDADNSTIWVAPQGDASGTWTRGAKDHMFFDSLLYKVEQEACIDTSRVFVVGFSFGAMYSHSLARSHQRVLRGVVAYAPGEVNIYGPPENVLPLAWMGTSGVSDATVTPTMSRTARNRFVNYNGGDSTRSMAEVSAGSKAHVCSSYPDVKERFPVRWCSFDGTHDYMPKDGTSTTSWVPAETWKFITQF